MKPAHKSIAPVVFGALQCGLTTGIATALATVRQYGLSTEGLAAWASSWLMSWFILLPIVIVMAPSLQRLAERLMSHPHT